MTSLNLAPDNIVGESFGGIVHAFLDGRFTLDQALEVAYYCSMSSKNLQQSELKNILEKVGKITLITDVLSSSYITYLNERVKLIDSEIIVLGDRRR